MLGGNHEFTFTFPAQQQSSRVSEQKTFSFSALPSTKKPVEQPITTTVPNPFVKDTPFFPTQPHQPQVFSGNFNQSHASAKSQERTNSWTNCLKSGDWSIWSEFERRGVLGTGAYGRVYLAADRQTNQLVAIKKTIMPEEDGAFLNPTTLREITILRKLNGHPNIVKFLGCRVPDLTEPIEGTTPFGLMASPAWRNNAQAQAAPNAADKRAVWMIMEYVEQDLGKLMKDPKMPWAPAGQPKGLPAALVKSFCFQILAGLTHCHENLVLHRDLKPCNILINDQGKVKITDFGLGRTHQVPMPPYSPNVVTLFYRAPEICLKVPTYMPVIDVWSAGCIFAEMVTGRVLFNVQANNEYDLLICIFRILGVPDEVAWPGLESSIPGDAEHGYARTFLKSQRRANYQPRGLAKCVPGLDAQGLDLLKKMLVYNPSQRMTPRTAMSHPYFADLDLNRIYTAEELKSIRGTPNRK